MSLFVILLYGKHGVLVCRQKTNLPCLAGGYGGGISSSKLVIPGFLASVGDLTGIMLFLFLSSVSNTISFSAAWYLEG